MNSLPTKILAALCLASVQAIAAFSPVSFSVMTDTNGAVIAPTNFWAANADYISAPQQSGTVFLDGIAGSDTTGDRGTQRPFATLSAALAALQSGDMLILRPGTYTVEAQYYRNDSDELTLTNGIVGLSNITLWGCNAVLYATNYGNLLTIQQCTNVTIDGITFQYRVLTTNEIGTNHISAAVNHRRTNWSTTVRNCRFLNCPDQAISHCWPTYARPSSKWTIVNNYFENIGTTNHPRVGMRDGAMVSGRPREMIFSGNRSEGLNVYGVELDGGGTGSPPDEFGNIVLVGNVLRGIYAHGFIASGTSNCPISGIMIANNFLEFHTLGYGSLINLSSAYDVFVSANRLKGNVAIAGSGERNGVYFGTSYGEEPGWYDILIENNLFWGLTFGVKIGLSETQVAMKVDDARLINNSFYNTGESCIVACGASLTIDGNSFYGGGTAAGSYPYAIWLYDFDDAPLTNCVVRRNILDDKQGTPLITRFLYVQTDAATPTASLQVYDNQILRMKGTNAYQVAGGVLSTPLTALLATDTICPGRTTMRVAGSGGAVTLTSTPSILSAFDGVTLTLVGTSDSNTLTIQDDGTLSGSAVQLGSTNRVLGLGDVLSLRFDGTTTNWFETGFNDN